jgi:hypothetical protein
MDDFVLIDLNSQRHAVAMHLAPLGEAAKLEWLRQYGELTELPLTPDYPRTFAFQSWLGMEAGFCLREGIFIFLGDQTTFT